MNNNTIELIKKIKTLRKEKGLSQVELAKRCHVPQSTIGRIETCSMNPSIDLVVNILEVLNLEFNINEKHKILKGYDVFGKEYGYMLRNDLHDINSVEHKLMQELVKLDSVSEPFLYGGYQITYPMEKHNLYHYSQRFKSENSLKTIEKVMKFTSNMAGKFDVSLEKMFFGGTEKEILDRGTDWCFDLSRLSTVILDCLGLTSRFVFVAHPNKAYYGHVLLEVFYENNWGVVDPLYGYVFYDKTPISAKNIFDYINGKDFEEDYKNMFKQIAIVEYNPNDAENKYIVSKCNEYTFKINTIKQDGSWLLGEDKNF